MKRMQRVGFFFGLVIMIAGLTARVGWASPTDSGPKPLVIGVITDAVTNYNICQAQGALLAIEQINRQGGILGRKIKVVTADDREEDPATSIESGINAVEKLITHDKAQILIGTWRSEFAIATANTARRYRKISFVGGSTSVLGDNVEKHYDQFKYFFKIHGWPNIRTSAMVWKDWIVYLMKRLKKEGKPITVALVGDTTHMSKNTVPVLEKFLTDAGARVAGKVVIPFRATDVATEMSALRKSGASYVMVVLGGGPSAYAMARQYYDLKLPMPILGAVNPGQSEPDWYGVTGGKGRWWAVTGWFSWPPPKFEGAESFMEAYRARWGHNPASVAPGAYETIYALKAAIESARSFDTDAVIKALEKVKIKGISKPYVQWNKRHETPYPWGSPLMLQWQGPNKLVTVYPAKYASGKLVLKAPYEK